LQCYNAAPVAAAVSVMCLYIGPFCNYTRLFCSCAIKHGSFAISHWRASSGGRSRDDFVYRALLQLYTAHLKLYRALLQFYTALAHYIREPVVATVAVLVSVAPLAVVDLMCVCDMTHSLCVCVP